MPTTTQKAEAWQPGLSLVNPALFVVKPWDSLELIKHWQGYYHKWNLPLLCLNTVLSTLNPKPITLNHYTQDPHFLKLKPLICHPSYINKLLTLGPKP